MVIEIDNTSLVDNDIYFTKYWVNLKDKGCKRYTE